MIGKLGQGGRGTFFTGAPPRGSLPHASHVFDLDESSARGELHVKSIRGQSRGDPPVKHRREIPRCWKEAYAEDVEGDWLLSGAESLN